MTAASISEPIQAQLSRGRLLAMAALGAALLWHLFLPTFFYRNAAVWIEGPLPALLGGAVAFRYAGEERFSKRLWASAAGALLTMIVAIAIVGSFAFGVVDAAWGLVGLVRASCRLPFSAVIELWGNERFVYGLWSGLKPLIFWFGLAYLGWRLRHGGWGNLISDFGQQRAFQAEQRRQHRSYRTEYLEAVRKGQAPPAPPVGLIGQPSGGLSLSHSYWLLRIAVLLIGALGLFGSVYAVLGEGLSDTVMSVFLRGLIGG